MTSKRGRKELLEFLDYLAQKGLMNKTTAQSRKASANAVLSVLSEEEASDVTKIDLDDVMVRFHNLEGQKFTPGSLNTYKSRTRSAIDDYVRYLENPLTFRAKTPSGSRPKRSKEGENSLTPTNSPNSITSAKVAERTNTPIGQDSILPIPLRVDLTVYVQGLPFDLTANEAKKIANVVLAMALPE